MDEVKEQIVRAWLIKAARDYLSAKILAAKDELRDTAIFHYQQAAEKAVKGFLVYHDIRFEKSHDVEFLVSLGMTKNSGLGQLLSQAEYLTPYATAFRYPGDVLESDEQEYEKAHDAARDICRFVVENLPKEITSDLDSVLKE